MKKMNKKKLIMIIAAVLAVIAAVLLLWRFVLSGGDSPGGIVAGAEEESTLYVDLKEDIKPAREISGNDVVCVTVLNDAGEAAGIEMRFSQRTDIEDALRSPGNIYFGSVGGAVVPAEKILITTDVTANEYVITLVFPEGEALTGREVCFYLAERAEKIENVLFKATGKWRD
ncbi:MAG: hypothetical protein FWF05_01480 [Oscillospiraceae bacterium]|nr:hypothetical protein [Oscillospiraceae bacterium]